MAAQAIRDTVTMEQVLAMYGYRTKRGFMCCPFHGEKEPSLKVYPGTKGWHCFGCGKGGSVIDFVMEHEGCDFRTAVTAIDKALRLGLQDPREDPQENRRNEQLQRWFDDFTGAVHAYLDVVRMKIEHELRTDLARVKECEMLRDMDPEKLTAKDWEFMAEFDEISQDNEYRLDRIRELREEVDEWRRKARRAKA